ncbi:MAG: hypothetical protein QFF03_04970 [Pseudomonadota bacterium]|nr:hypothetical protein [Pseudomonadota bacterium]
MSSDLGPILLRGIDLQIGLTARIAAALPDRRHQSYVNHSYQDVVPNAVRLFDEFPYKARSWARAWRWWSAQHAGAVSMANGFVGSVEFNNHYGALDNAAAYRRRGFAAKLDRLPQHAHPRRVGGRLRRQCRGGDGAVRHPRPVAGVAACSACRRRGHDRMRCRLNRLAAQPKIALSAHFPAAISRSAAGRC